MSQESFEIVRQHIEAFRAQDAQRAAAFLDPYLVWDASRTGGAAGAGNVLYGPESLKEFVRRYQGSFDRSEYEVERLTDLGSGAVIAAVTETALGRTSGVPVMRAYAVLYSVIDRRIVRMTLFPSEQAAFEAV